MPPIPPTIIFLSLPPTSLLGLDTIALTPSPRFVGITLIPPGWHFLYAGATASLSARTGSWLHVPSSPSTSPDVSFLRIFAWSTETEALHPVTAAAAVEGWGRRLLEGDAEVRGGLLPYGAGRRKLAAAAEVARSPEGEEGAEGRLSVAGDESGNVGGEVSATEAVDFDSLTQHVSPQLLARLTGSDGCGSVWVLSTTSCAVEDRDEIPGLDAGERRFDHLGETLGGDAGMERELRFLGIDLRKTWREGAVGEERTSGARDRSWALERLVEKEGRENGVEEGVEEGEEEEWGHVVLGEMEVCFLMVLLLANYSCLEEWKRILNLVLTCNHAVERQPGFFITFLRVLKKQLERCGDVEGGLFDVRGEEAGWLKGLLRGFRRGLEEFGSEAKKVKAEMKSLDAWVESEWGWELGDEFVRRGMVDLEDGERVEVEMDDMEGEDERGEYAPVIVDL